MNILDIFKKQPVAQSMSAKKHADITIQIIQEFKDRNRKDIDKWRQAITAAENIDDPRWFLIQDLYDDLIDAHLASVTDIRKFSTMNHPFYVTDLEGNELPEQSKLLNDEWFYGFINLFFEAIFYKYSVLQVFKGEDGKPFIKIVTRRNICIQNKRLYLEVSGDKYINYNDFPNVIEILDNSNFGIMNDIIPNAIWKRNAMQAAAEYAEKFGFPLVTAETNNKTEVPRIQKSLIELGQAATGVFPVGTSITVHDLANAGDPEKVFGLMADRQDKQIGKRFLGSVTMTEQNGNRAQSEVHERTLDNKIATADKRNFRFTVQNKLFPVLQYLGFPFDSEKMIFKFDDTESLSLSQHWNIVKDAHQFYELDHEKVAETFRLPIIAKKEVKDLIPSPGGVAANFR